MCVHVGNPVLECVEMRRVRDRQYSLEEGQSWSSTHAGRGTHFKVAAGTGVALEGRREEARALETHLHLEILDLHPHGAQLPGVH